MRDHALHLFQSNIAGGGEYRVQLRGPLEDIASDLKLIEGTPFRQMEQRWVTKQKRRTCARDSKPPLFFLTNY